MSQKSSVREAPVVTYATLVGKVLQQERKARNIEQAEMAQALGISQSAYSRLESGGSTLTITQLRAAARKIGIEPHRILSEADRVERDVLVQEGVDVVAEKPSDATAAIVGLGILIALLANK